MEFFSHNQKKKKKARIGNPKVTHHSFSSLAEQISPKPSGEVEQGRCAHRLGWGASERCPSLTVCAGCPGEVWWMGVSVEPM